MMQRLKVDRTPLHLQAQQHLLSLIEDGTYQPGEQLPSEVDLAAQLGISRPTLREALLNLEQEGIIVRKHGVGTFVASEPSSPLRSGLERLESILGLAARQGMTTRMRGLSVDQVLADEELAERLDIAPGTPLTCVRRTILVKRRPAAYLVDYSPVTTLPPEALGPTFAGSILDLLLQRNGMRVREALAEITAINADPLLAEQLEIEPGQALLLLTETLFADDNAPVEFSHNYFLPDLFSFHVLRR
jgi:GntR family transcriptional regulator